MFTILNVNSANFSAVSNSFNGIMLKYSSVKRIESKNALTGAVEVRTEVKNSALVFSGSEFELEDLKAETIFNAWKRIVAIFWETYAKQRELQKDNGGIRSKLKTATPSAIVFTNKNRTASKTINVESSVWAKIGLIPTTRDLIDHETDTPKDWKKNIHKITKASWDALKFQPQIGFAVSKSEEQAGKKRKTIKGVAEQKAS